jgi:hypothetical protein
MISEIAKRLEEERKNSPWYVKLKRWWKFKRWKWMCETRFIWDSNYEENIFRKLKNKIMIKRIEETTGVNSKRIRIYFLGILLYSSITQQTPEKEQ